MDRTTYEQLDRIESKLDQILEVLNSADSEEDNGGEEEIEDEEVMESPA